MGMTAAEIKNSYLLSEIIGKYVELKPKGNEFWGCCPFHGERTSSFHVQDARRSWHCYGCGLHGDVFDFICKIDDCDLPTACRSITAAIWVFKKSPAPLPPIIDVYSDLKPIPALSTDLPKPNEWVKVWNPKHTELSPAGRFVNYKPQLVHPYHAKNNELLGCTIRVNMPDRKIVPMLRMVEKDGQRTWSHFPFPAPRGLYGLETLKFNRENPILIVEGEKCADIGRRVIGGTVLTWAGGTNAAKFTDWWPLREREILLWPDADQVGIEAMMGKKNSDGKIEKGVYQFLLEVGAKEIKCLGIDKSKPKGWDIGDAVIRERWSRGHIIQWMKERLKNTALETVV